MSIRHKPGLIESLAEKIGLIPNLHEEDGPDLPSLTEGGALTDYPPPDQWDDWVEYDPQDGGPSGLGGNYYHRSAHGLFQLRSSVRASQRTWTKTLSPFASSKVILITREAADKNCAKGPATINQSAGPGTHSPSR